MAIYTNYGRYLKAKKFKESLDSLGSTYMLFGIGNPRWDNNDDKIPIAPYNLNICTVPSATTNQFHDECAYQNFLYDISGTIYNIESLQKSVATGNNYIGKYLDYVRYLNPVFPCTWRQGNDDDVLVTIDSENITVSEFNNYYILERNNLYDLYKIGYGAVVEGFDLQTNTSDAQYCAELYLRGLSLEKKSVTPPGLLGMIKCEVDFVIDIGTEETNYTGDINQFFYGDRYWQIVKDPEEVGINQYYETYKDLLGEQLIFPTHLIFTTLVNPRLLCNNLKIDHLLEPRQLAIVTSSDSTNKNHYDVGSNYFNFGQYYQKEAVPTTDPDTASEWCYINDGNSVTADDNFLNFILPVKITYDSKDHYYGNNYSDEYDYTDASTGETSKKYKSQNNFKFLLHDYIRGASRDIHTADRFGYVVGF